MVATTIVGPANFRLVMSREIAELILGGRDLAAVCADGNLYAVGVTPTGGELLERIPLTGFSIVDSGVRFDRAHWIIPENNRTPIRISVRRAEDDAELWAYETDDAPLSGNDLFCDFGWMI